MIVTSALVITITNRDHQHRLVTDRMMHLCRRRQTFIC